MQSLLLLQHMKATVSFHATCLHGRLPPQLPAVHMLQVNPYFRFRALLKCDFQLLALPVLPVFFAARLG